MLVLVDTNILLPIVEAAHVQFAETSAAVDALRKRGHQLVIVPQVLYEFWVVATRPVENNGLGMSPVEARQASISFQRVFRLLHNERKVSSVWEQLVTSLEIKGKQAHDARLAAAMIRFGVSHLLTHNTRDFLRYSTIAGMSPADVLSGAAVT